MESMIRGGKLALVLVIILLPLIFFGGIDLAEADNTVGGDDATQEEAWTKDLDKKIDKTIAILNVIKEEMQKAEEPLPSDKKVQAKTGEEEAEELGEKAGRAAGTMARIWRKIRDIIGVKEGEGTTEDKDEWSQDLSVKLDKTIAAMQGMKEELDKIKEEDARSE